MGGGHRLLQRLPQCRSDQAEAVRIAWPLGERLACFHLYAQSSEYYTLLAVAGVCSMVYLHPGVLDAKVG